MRRRWSIKEIVNIIYDDLARNGKLKQRIVTLVNDVKQGKEVKK